MGFCFTCPVLCIHTILLKVKKSEKGEEVCVFQIPNWSAREDFPGTGIRGCFAFKMIHFLMQRYLPLKDKNLMATQLCLSKKQVLSIQPSANNDSDAIDGLQTGDDMVSKPQNKREEAGGWSRTKRTDSTAARDWEAPAWKMKKVWLMRRSWHQFSWCAWLNTLLLLFTDCPTVAASFRRRCY